MTRRQAIDAGSPDAWEAYRAILDHRREVAKRRAPPQRTGIGAGHCRWCGDPVLYPEGHKMAGRLNLRRSWHAPCVWWHKVATNGFDAMRDAVFARDRGVCAICRRECPDVFDRWRTYPRQPVTTDHGLRWFDRLTPSSDGHASYFSTIEPQIRSTWHADHIVPIWSIAGATLDNRGCFWSLVNLQTLCDVHHGEKTRLEATARAALRRSAARCSATSVPLARAGPEGSE